MNLEWPSSSEVFLFIFLVTVIMSISLETQSYDVPFRHAMSQKQHDKHHKLLNSIITL